MSDKLDKSKKSHSTVSTKHFEHFTAQSLIAYAYENDVITVNEFRQFLRLPALEQGRIVKRFYDKIKPNARRMADSKSEKDLSKKSLPSSVDERADAFSAELADVIVRQRDKREDEKDDTLVLPPLGSAKSAS